MTPFFGTLGAQGDPKILQRRFFCFSGSHFGSHPSKTVLPLQCRAFFQKRHVREPVLSGTHFCETAAPKWTQGAAFEKKGVPKWTPFWTELIQKAQISRKPRSPFCTPRALQIVLPLQCRAFFAKTTFSRKGSALKMSAKTAVPSVFCKLLQK